MVISSSFPSQGELQPDLFFDMFILCVYVCMHGIHVEVRGQLVGPGAQMHVASRLMCACSLLRIVIPAKPRPQLSLVDLALAKSLGFLCPLLTKTFIPVMSLC